jgi:hypothetical protein
MTSFRPSVIRHLSVLIQKLTSTSVHYAFRFPFEGPEFKPGFNKILSFCILKNEKKNKNDDFIPWRTDFILPLHYIALHITYCIALHCIALHCIALHSLYCIALHCIACIALHCITCILTERVLIVRHVCSWIVSVTFNFTIECITSIGSVCFVCLCLSNQLFLAPDLRTDGQTYLTMRLNWN